MTQTRGSDLSSLSFFMPKLLKMPNEYARIKEEKEEAIV